MKITKFMLVIIVAVALFLIMLAFVYVQNNVIGITYFDIDSPKIFREVTLVHLSDLHNKEFGKENANLVNEVKLLEPDILFFTGDLIDSNTQDLYKSVNTLKELNKLAPIYYIPGNHEHWSGKFQLLSKILKEANVEVLNCDNKTIKIKGQDISILGLDEMANSNQIIENSLVKLSENKGFNIVLSHYPENFSNTHSNYKIDIVLSGHAHGGQFDLPFFGGVFAPGQGFFPKYYKGMYEENGVKLLVSRGLGNSVIPVRVFNRPEIIVINLK